MNHSDLLNQLWGAYRDQTFASFSLQKKLDLRHAELTQALQILAELSESGEAVPVTSDLSPEKATTGHRTLTTGTAFRVKRMGNVVWTPDGPPRAFISTNFRIECSTVNVVYKLIRVDSPIPQNP